MFLLRQIIHVHSGQSSQELVMSGVGVGLALSFILSILRIRGILGRLGHSHNSISIAITSGLPRYERRMLVIIIFFENVLQKGIIIV